MSAHDKKHSMFSYDRLRFKRVSLIQTIAASPAHYYLNNKMLSVSRLVAGHPMLSNSLETLERRNEPIADRFGQWGRYAAAVVISIITIIFFISSSPRIGFYGVSLFLLFLLLLCVYMLPMIIAIYRHHRNTNTIAVLNIYFGWTFVGWVIALVWSFTADTEKVSAGRRN